MSDHPIRILLVEDNPADARLLRESLREASAAGYAVTWADRLASGLARLAADAPDVVFLDLSLPDSQGLETFRAMRGQAPAAPIIVLTGLDDDALALAAVHEGAQDYLVKGQVDSNLLGRAIRYAIERQQVQARLLEERNLLRTLIDNLPDNIFVKDTESRIVIDNVAHRRLLGVTTLDQVVGKRDADFFAPELADRYTADEQRVIRTGEPLVNREEPTLDPACTPRWLLTTKVPLRDQQGQVSGIVGISRDITERKRAEEALRQSAVRLEVLHQVDQAILTARPLAALVQMALEGLRRLVPCRSTSVVLFVSAASEDTILAVQADGETGTAGGTRISTEAPLIAALQRGEVRVIEDLGSLAELPPALQSLRADEVRSLVNVPLLADGELLGMVTLTWQHRGACSPEQVEIARAVADQLAVAIRQARLREQVTRHTAELEQRVADRTAELRAANDQLKELDRFKSSFVSDVSHELRQPLTNIKTYLYLLDRGKPEKRAGYLATLHRETDLLQQLIEDLLHLSRIDLGKVQPVLAPLDINRLVGTLVEDRVPLAAEHGLALHIALAPDLPPVMADAKMVTQVLTNLLANAMNYTPRGGAVTVKTRYWVLGIADDTQYPISNTQPPTSGTWVVFSVTDTGPGIAAEEQTRIFERFYRGEAARVSRAPGTGLGLAICQELIQRHEGKITLESQVGQGSTFTVWLPAKNDG